MKTTTPFVFSTRLIIVSVVLLVGGILWAPKAVYADQESDCISACSFAFPSFTYTPEPGDERTPQQQESYNNYHLCVNACIDQFGLEEPAPVVEDAAPAPAPENGDNTTTVPAGGGNGATTPSATNPTGYNSTPSGKTTAPTVSASKLLPTLLPECATTTGSCGICDVFAMFGNIAEILLDLISGVVILMVIIGGVFWISSAGSSDRIDRGKQILIGAFIGSVFVFAGFVLVNLTMIALLGGAGKSGSYGIVSPFGNTEWNALCTDVSGAAPLSVKANGGCTSETVGDSCGSGVPVCAGRTDCRCVAAYDVQSVTEKEVPRTGGLITVPDIIHQSSISFFCTPTSSSYCKDVQKEGVFCYRTGSDYVGLCKDDTAAGGWQCTYNVLGNAFSAICGVDDDGRSCQACTTPGACFCKAGACVSKCEERVKEITGKAGVCVASENDCPVTTGAVIYGGDAFSCGSGVGPSAGNDICCSMPQ